MPIATMSEAAADTSAAADRALGAAEASIRVNAGAAIGNTTDATLDKTGNAMKGSRQRNRGLDIPTVRPDRAEVFLSQL